MLLLFSQNLQSALAATGAEHGSAQDSASIVIQGAITGIASQVFYRRGSTSIQYWSGSGIAVGIGPYVVDSESAGLSDSQSIGLSATPSVIDAGYASDVSVLSIQINLSMSEGGKAVDTQSASSAIAASNTESVGAKDANALSLSSGVLVSDVGYGQESISTALAASVSNSESGAASDSQSLTAAIQQALTDSAFSIDSTSAASSFGGSATASHTYRRLGSVYPVSWTEGGLVSNSLVSVSVLESAGAIETRSVSVSGTSIPVSAQEYANGSDVISESKAGLSGGVSVAYRQLGSQSVILWTGDGQASSSSFSVSVSESLNGVDSASEIKTASSGGAVASYRQIGSQSIMLWTGDGIGSGTSVYSLSSVESSQILDSTNTNPATSVNVNEAGFAIETRSATLLGAGGGVAVSYRPLGSNQFILWTGDGIATGAAFSATIAEAVNVSEIESVNLSGSVSNFESLSASDFQTTTPMLGAVIGESQKAIDSQASGLSAALNIVESLNASDAPSLFASFTQSLVESGNAVESISESLIAPATISESARAIDSQSETAFLFISVTEYGSAIDGNTASNAASLTIKETGNGFDVISASGNRSFAASLNENLSASDIVTLLSVAIPPLVSDPRYTTSVKARGFESIPIGQGNFISSPVDRTFNASPESSNFTASPKARRFTS